MLPDVDAWPSIGEGGPACGVETMDFRGKVFAYH